MILRSRVLTYDAAAFHRSTKTRTPRCMSCVCPEGTLRLQRRSTVDEGGAELSTVMILTECGTTNCPGGVLPADSTCSVLPPSHQSSTAPVRALRATAPT